MTAGIPLHTAAGGRRKVRSVRLSCLSDEPSAGHRRVGRWLIFAPAQPTRRLLRLTVAGHSPAPVSGSARHAALYDCHNTSTKRSRWPAEGEEREAGRRFAPAPPTRRRRRLTVAGHSPAPVSGSARHNVLHDCRNTSTHRSRWQAEGEEHEAILPQRRAFCRPPARWAIADFRASAAGTASAPAYCRRAQPGSRGCFRASAADTASAPAYRRRAQPGSHTPRPLRQRSRWPAEGEEREAILPQRRAFCRPPAALGDG
jgi:hypothetical protein